MTEPVLFENGLFSFLTSDTAVGGMIGTRMYGSVAPPHAALPRIVYTKVADGNTQTMCATDSVKGDRYQLDCYAKDYKTSKLLAKLVKNSMVDFRGFMGDTYVKTVILETDHDLTDPDPGLNRVSQTYLIWFVEN